MALSPTAADRRSLQRLAHKYETLAALRRARANGEPIPEKAVFKTLSTELPGALYELDRLPLDEIDARRHALERALAGEPEAPWIRPMATYHALYRAALHVKSRAPRGRPLTAEEASALASAASRHASIDVGASFASVVARPANGRIGPVVLAETAARHGLPEAELSAALFPTRRKFTPGGGGAPTMATAEPATTKR